MKKNTWKIISVGKWLFPCSNFRKGFSMGVLSLYTVLAGGAWLTKEYILEAYEREDDNARGRAIKNYIAEHTNPEIEEQMRKYVATTPDSEIWKRIETFKRDNPVYCEREIRRNPPNIVTWYDGTKRKYVNTICWSRVGNERYSFYASKNTQYEQTLASDHRKQAVCYLMQTYGKKAYSHAEAEAKKLFPMKKSKRGW